MTPVIPCGGNYCKIIIRRKLENAYLQWGKKIQEGAK